MEKAKVVREILSDTSVVWNVEYHEGDKQKRFINITIGCVGENEAKLLAMCLNNAAWMQADIEYTD